LRLEKAFHWQNDKYFWGEFDLQVKNQLSHMKPGSVVADLGGGRRFIYASHVPNAVEIWAIDIDQHELDLNLDVEVKILGDVSKALPLENQSVDLILSRALLEHVEDNEAALIEMYRILKPGGKMLHFVPARYSTFGVAARILPFEMLKNILHSAIPGTKGVVEFPVYYNLCTSKGMTAQLIQKGFTDISVKTCYHANSYFYPVFPAYLLVIAYEFVIRILKISALSQYLIVSAQK
jgi:ubiquinone/menaquinone biosynthesis C-methylase UbiE